STGIEAVIIGHPPHTLGVGVVFARRLVVHGTQQRLPPSQSPRPPALLQAGGAERHLSGTRLHPRWWRILASTDADYGPPVPVMGRYQVEREFLKLVGHLE